MPLGKAGEGAIFVNGDITFEDREQFLLKISPFTGGVVIFNSRGGSAYAGIEIGKAIRLRNFATWVPSDSFCASACAIAWLGGTRRLMGSRALIGFHSVYVMDHNSPVETAPGNALFGAYLSQLGLSERAIVYLTSAPPESMNWLTPQQAEAVGISFRILDNDVSPPAPSPSPQISESPDLRARNFVIAVNVLVSSPNEKYLPVLDGLYADTVMYFGKLTSRTDVINQIISFVQRWPKRVYAPNPSSVKGELRSAATTVSSLR
jgi:hypothetical protein